MSLVVEAHHNLINTGLRAASNAFITHLPIDLNGRDKIQNYVGRAQTRLEHASLHKPKSLLDGQIVAVKDNIWTSGFPTTCASSMLQGFQSPIDSNVVNGLQHGGAVVLGKTNMDEFGMGSHSTHSYRGAVRNDAVPGVARSAGGSSGGSAMAVLNGQCRVALATDTGGSVRLPAAYTGLIGFKPSYGRLSRFGVVPYANSLDTVGVIAKNCEDVLRTFMKLDRPDSHDPTCLSRSTRLRIADVKSARLRQRSGSAVRVVRQATSPWTETTKFPDDRRRKYPSLTPSTDWSRTIGVPTEYNIEEMSDSVRDAWIRTLSQLETLGHTILPISLPHTKAALSAYYVLAPAEASSNLAKYDGVRYGVRAANEADQPANEVLFAATRGRNFGAEVQRRILLGTYSLSSSARSNHFIQAQKVRRLVQRDFDSVFRLRNPLHHRTAAPAGGVDYIICPTAPTPPPRLLDLKHSTPFDAYMNDVFTVPASLAGLPAMSMPAPLGPGSDQVEYRNVGMQVIGQYGDDEGVVKFCQWALEARKEELAHYTRRRKKSFL